LRQSIWAGERPSPSSDQQKREQAKTLFDEGLSKEREAKFSDAIERFRKVQELYPDTALLHYHLGVCHQALGQMDEAITSLKAFLVAGTEEAEGEATDARRRLDAFLLPKLTRAQKEMYDLATDNLNAALRVISDAGSATMATKPLARAIELLLQLRKDVPSYLPLHTKLGLAYEQKKDYANAAAAYDEYLKGYEKLGYPPDNRSEVRTNKIACEAHVDQRKAEDTKKAEKRKILTDHGVCAVGTIGIPKTRTISFDGDMLVITTQLTDPVSPTVCGLIKKITRVDPRDINPDQVRYSPPRQPEVLEVNIVFETRDGANKIRVQSWNRDQFGGPLTEKSENECSGCLEADRSTAAILADALRELAKLSAR
jgi:tetratricopeptide (TPR) repeat protein